MSKKLPNLETQIRQAEALEKIADKFVGKYPFRVYGVTGLGGENPQLRRTHDAEDVELIITENPDDSDLLNATLSDSLMHEFFNFDEYTDHNDNVFVVGRPLAIKYFLASSNEVIGFGVAEYFDGIEAYGFRPFTANKKWLSEYEYDGVGEISIAKYLSSAWDTNNEEVFEGFIGGVVVDDIEVNSKKGLKYALSEVDWDNGMQIIKNTDNNYNPFHWSYHAYLRMLQFVFFAHTNIFEVFNVEFPYTNVGEETEGVLQDTTTGTTDDILSHTGFNKLTNQFKIFNIDAYISMTNLNGLYGFEGEYFYSRMIDTDSKYDGGYLKSTIAGTSFYGGEWDIITKMSFDSIENDLQIPTALRQITPQFPEDSISNIFYSSKAKINNLRDYRVMHQVHSNYVGVLWVQGGISSLRADYDFDLAWLFGCYDGSLRLCKPPF